MINQFRLQHMVLANLQLKNTLKHIQEIMVWTIRFLDCLMFMVMNKMWIGCCLNLLVKRSKIKKLLYMEMVHR